MRFLLLKYNAVAETTVAATFFVVFRSNYPSLMHMLLQPCCQRPTWTCHPNQLNKPHTSVDNRQV